MTAGQFIRFVAAVGLAFLLWLSVMLAETYTVTLHRPAAYPNVEPALAASSGLPQELDITVRARGVDLVLPAISGSTDTIRLLLNGSSRNYMQADALLEEVGVQMPRNLQTLSIAPDSFNLVHSPLISRRLPVASRLRLTPERGFMFTDSVSFSPDSVLLRGPARLLQTMTHCPTASESFSDVKNKWSAMIPLEPPAGVVVTPRKTLARVRTGLFTGGAYKRPVLVRNAPLQRNVRLIPPQVKVHFAVEFEEFEQIRAQEFIISVDFNELTGRGEIVKPEIERAPAGVRGVRLDPPYVRYVISEVNEPI